MMNPIDSWVQNRAKKDKQIKRGSNHYILGTCMLNTTIWDFQTFLTVIIIIIMIKLYHNARMTHGSETKRAWVGKIPPNTSKG